MVLRLYHLARVFAFGYFFGLGFMALTHYLGNWPETYDEASLLALIPGVSALVANLARERRTPPPQRTP